MHVPDGHYVMFGTHQDQKRKIDSQRDWFMDIGVYDLWCFKAINQLKVSELEIKN